MVVLTAKDLILKTNSCLRDDVYVTVHIVRCSTCCTVYKCSLVYTVRCTTKQQLQLKEKINSEHNVKSQMKRQYQ